MKTQFKPQGVCSDNMDIEVEDGIITNVSFHGGCNGNLTGISRLVVGMRVDDAVERLSGIKCGRKDTSCPDQLAKALKSFL